MEGEFYEHPLRLICAECSLMEGYVDNGARERIEAMPLNVVEDGKKLSLKLRPFQEVDALEIATARAKLIGHAMGCGKTVIASIASLRADTGNILFCPASVKRNWAREIRRWRADLDVSMADTQANFHKRAPLVLSRPGSVLIGSFGVLPGNPCRGCRWLRKTLKMLKKEKRYSGPIPEVCEHRTPAEPHPRTFTAFIDGKEQTILYHKKCENGCYQVNPTPKITTPAVLMADECHALKNPRTDRTRNWRNLRASIWAAGGYVYGLSGTPCEGKPPEFWEVLCSLGLEKAAFGNWNTYYRIFQAWYDNPKGRRRAPEGELKDELHRRIQRVQVRRRREDVLKDLPPVIEKTIEVELDERTIKEVNEAVHHMLAVRAAWDDIKRPMNPVRKIQDPYEGGLTTDEKDRRKAIYDQRVEEYFKERPWNEDEEITQAVQEALISRDNLPAIEELSRIRSMLSQAKVAAVKEWMQSCEEELEPAILFSEHVQILKKLTERPGWECFHGGLTAKKRQSLVDRFQNGSIESGMAVSIRAGGEGITLTRARVCAYIDLSWNPAKNRQSLARLLRIGAEVHDSIVAVYFVANHVVDKLVQETIFEKQLIMDSLDWDTSIAP
jgi:SNF2 family DNA or RNA helicase